MQTVCHICFHLLLLQTLVQQLEAGKDGQIDKEVQDSQSLLNSSKAGESVEQDLKAQLALCEKELLAKEDLIEQLNIEKESLAAKVLYMYHSLYTKATSLTLVTHVKGFPVKALCNSEGH